MLLLVEFLFFTVLSILCWKFYVRSKPFYDISKKTKNLSLFELIQLTPAFFTDHTKIFVEFQKKMKKKNSFLIGHYYMYFPKDPNEIKTILNSEETFDKSFHYEFFFSIGLLVENGEKYKRQRKALNPLFYPTNIKSLSPLINLKTGTFLNDFESNFGLRNVNLRDAGLHFVANTIFTTIFGAESGSFEHIREIIESFEVYTKNVGIRSFTPWLFRDFMFKWSKMGRETEQAKLNIWRLLSQNFNSCLNGKNRGKYFKYMEKFAELENWKSEDLLADFVVLFFGSFDTSGSTIAHILLLLAMNPKCQEELFKELSSVLKSSDDEVSEEIYSQLPYLTLVIKEGMRMIPAVLLQTRQVRKSLKLDNYTLPEGTNIGICALEVHTDKEIWGEDALQFKPERFLDENLVKIHPYAYIPFSNGPRICIGYKYAMMSMKIFLSRFLMKYRVSTTMKYEDLTYILGATMRTKQDLIVNVEKR